MPAGVTTVRNMPNAPIVDRHPHGVPHPALIPASVLGTWGASRSA